MKRKSRNAIPKIYNVGTVGWDILKKPNIVYCGRANGLWGKWGNPLSIGEIITADMVAKYEWKYTLVGDVVTRDMACDGYEVHLDKMIAARRLDPTELAGKDLVCHCAPKRCHCEILRRRANPGLVIEQGSLFDVTDFNERVLVEH